MFLIDKYSINDPWDVLFHQDIYKKLLNLNNLNSWLDDYVEHNDHFNTMPNLLIYGNEGCGKWLWV